MYYGGCFWCQDSDQPFRIWCTLQTANKMTKLKGLILNLNFKDTICVIYPIIPRSCLTEVNKYLLGVYYVQGNVPGATVNPYKLVRKMRQIRELLQEEEDSIMA